MSRWNQDFEQHRIHNILKTIRALFDSEMKDIDANHEAERNRFLKVIDRLSVFLKNVDPEFLSFENLEQLSQQLENAGVMQNLQIYSNNPDIKHLRQVNNYLTYQIALMLTLIEPTSELEAKEKISDLEKEYEKFHKTLENEKEEFFELKGMLKSSMESFQNKKDKFNHRYEVNLNQSFDEFMRKFNEKHKIMNEKHLEILDLHQMVVEDGVAAGYKKHADYEGKSARIWRRITMVFYCLTLAWLVFRVMFKFGFADGGAFDWAELTATLSVTAVALGVTQYTSRQSRMHRDREQQMRWFSLEVTAIGPLIKTLPSKMSEELQHKLIERMFGKDRVAENKPRNRSFFLKSLKKD